MPRNIELKARLHDPAMAVEVASELAGGGPTLLIQCDTYFVCPQGRLKLRHHEGGSAQLIWYQREDELGATPSQYEIVDVPDPRALTMALSSALGIDTIVKKRRRLWLIDNVRIHIDEVDALGHFVEFEAVLDEAHDDPEEAIRVINGLAEQLQIRPMDRIAQSYREMVRPHAVHR